jgi:hypothetical protein
MSPLHGDIQGPQDLSGQSFFPAGPLVQWVGAAFTWRRPGGPARLATAAAVLRALNVFTTAGLTLSAQP